MCLTNVYTIFVFVLNPGRIIIVVVVIVDIIIIILDVFAESPSADDSRSHEHSLSNSQYLLKQTVYQCPLCARLTLSLNSLISHLARHRLQSSVDSQSGRHHRCSVCGKLFSHAAVLASHLHVVHQGQLWSLVLLLLCNVCCVYVRVTVNRKICCKRNYFFHKDA